MAANPEQNPDVNLEYTGERHIFGQMGVEMLPFANLEHMIRYAFVAPFVKGKRVLDISCGSGYGTQYLALQGASQVVGVDIDRESIEFAKKYHTHEVITYIESDAHQIQELEDATFDVIISFETVEHVQRPREFLFELKRLLKSDGQAFISCPNDYRVSPWISEYHLHKFRFSDFRDLMTHTFGKAAFLGQHQVIAACLIKPNLTHEYATQFQAYQDNTPTSVFTTQYIEHISGIENADGYLGIVGVEMESISNHLSISQDAFLAVMKLQVEVQAQATQEIKKMQQMQSQFAIDLANYQEKYHQDLESIQIKYLQESELQQQKMQAQVEFTRQESDLSQQKIQAELAATQADLIAKQQLIEALQAKVNVLEERHGQLLREKTYTQNSHPHPRTIDLEQSLMQAQQRIAAMETSKFWQLRKNWFQFKRSLSLPGADKE